MYFQLVILRPWKLQRKFMSSKNSCFFIRYDYVPWMYLSFYRFVIPPDRICPEVQILWRFWKLSLFFLKVQINNNKTKIRRNSRLLIFDVFPLQSPQEFLLDRAPFNPRSCNRSGSVSINRPFNKCSPLSTVCFRPFDCILPINESSEARVAFLCFLILTFCVCQFLF